MSSKHILLIHLIFLGICDAAGVIKGARDFKDSELLEAHPDPNDEHYDGMIYVGKHDEETLSFTNLVLCYKWNPARSQLLLQNVLILVTNDISDDPNHFQR